MEAVAWAWVEVASVAVAGRSSLLEQEEVVLGAAVSVSASAAEVRLGGLCRRKGSREDRDRHVPRGRRRSRSRPGHVLHHRLYAGHLFLSYDPGPCHDRAARRRVLVVHRDVPVVHHHVLVVHRRVLVVAHGHVLLAHRRVPEDLRDGPAE